MVRSLSILLVTISFAFAQKPIGLTVDASDAAQRIIHASLKIPVSPGPFTLEYPKWIPGEHGPTGPVADLASLRISAAGKTLAWRRDDVDMFAIHVDVPAGANELEVSLDYLSPAETTGFTSGASATTELAVVSWNQVLLYPQGQPSNSLQYRARLIVPSGWSFGTALPIERESGNTVDFAPASLTTLIDSPVLSGRHLRTIELSPGAMPAHYLHLAADSDAALNLSPETIAEYKQLVSETGALFGARHYRSYHFLVTLSDHVAHFGLEHHESSDDRTNEAAMTDEDARRFASGLLPHEFVHSWNGKYRRPAGLATPDYEQPMKGRLLWIYEGLTEYLGTILTPRSGLLNAEEYREGLAETAANLLDTPGRDWRPLEDTAVAAQVLYGSRDDWENVRRTVDFYPEGELLWLDADVMIRKLSQGKKSLDDFCKVFHGGKSGLPEVKPYELSDVVTALNSVQPYDWESFLRTRVDTIRTQPPMGGIVEGGWKLSYLEAIPSMLRIEEEERHWVILRYSLGLELNEDGVIRDVIRQSPADKAGMAPGAKLLAVNGRQYTAKVIHAAIQSGKGKTEPMELLVKDGEIYKTFRVDYHGGDRYPYLERDESKPDVLSEIIRPHAR